MRIFQKFLYTANGFINFRQNITESNFFNIVLRVINHRFQIDNYVQKFTAQAAYLFGKLAFLLAHGNLQSRIAAGFNNIHYGFGLHQVNAPVQKSTLGKFTRLSRTRTGSITQRQNFL